MIIPLALNTQLYALTYNTVHNFDSDLHFIGHLTGTHSVRAVASDLILLMLEILEEKEL